MRNGHAGVRFFQHPLEGQEVFGPLEQPQASVGPIEHMINQPPPSPPAPRARATRELNRAGVDARERRWTRHGSTRHLFDEASVAGAVSYTLDEQGERMEIYDASTKEPRTK